ncbi:MAG TPA: hypothetical protein PLY27_03695 [Bacilli bacterium]|nr:hypothetical protein [Bacilli bacterium]
MDKGLGDNTKCFISGSSYLILVFEITLSAAHIRVGIASLAVFLVFAAPNVLSILNKESTKFQKVIAAISLLFLIFLLLRAFNSLFDNEIVLFTNNFFQIGTFLALVLLMLTNGVGFLLIMYDRSYALVKESSNLDPLTRIYNRRFFMNKAESYFKRHSKKMVTYHFFLLILIFSRK